MILSSYTRALKRYDPDLYAGRTMDGAPCVFRKVKRYYPVSEWDGGKLYELKRDKQLVFAITENWTMRTAPRDWGIDDVLGHVREIDALANARLFEELDAANDRVDESNKRALRNEMEGFWACERRRFAKATDDILTHSLSKDEPRKRLKDRSIKNA